MKQIVGKDTDADGWTTEIVGEPQADGCLLIVSEHRYRQTIELQNLPSTASAGDTGASQGKQEEPGRRPVDAGEVGRLTLIDAGQPMRNL